MARPEGRGRNDYENGADARENEATVKRSGAEGDYRGDQETVGGGSGRGEEVGERVVGVILESSRGRPR